MLRLLGAFFLIVVSRPVGAQEAPVVQPTTYDYSALYEALNPSIVKVFADSGTGSGFLVSHDGLIATNHHVVKNSRYVAVQFADGRKVIAAVVTLDPRFDLAVLKINCGVVERLTPLTLLPVEHDVEVRPGIPVVAFGSPLSQAFVMTQGIIAKVEENALLGDFVVQPGNSGGPLVTLKGSVIGINTFKEGAIAGAVRVTALRNVLASPAVAGYDRPDPPGTLLPVAPARRYPTETLKERVASEPLDAGAYRLDANKFTITAVTPVLLGKSLVQDDLVQARNRFSRRGRNINDPTWREVDTPFYEWVTTATSALDNVVTFEIKPDFGATSGSKWLSALSAVSVVASRSEIQTVHQNVEFKAEFLDFKLFRDGELIIPVHPGRAITEAAFRGGSYTFVDEAYTGMYSYNPDVFVTGEAYRLEVFDAREPSKAHAVLSLTARDPLIQQLRKDFSNLEERSDGGPGATSTEPNSSGAFLPRWTTNVPGLDVKLGFEGDTGFVEFSGSGDLAGIKAPLNRSAEGFTGTYRSEKCDVTGSVELREIANGWQASVVRIDCSSRRPKQIRTGVLLLLMR